jgi:hypothetical protein
MSLSRKVRRTLLSVFALLAGVAALAAVLLVAQPVAAKESGCQPPPQCSPGYVAACLNRDPGADCCLQWGPCRRQAQPGPTPRPGPTPPPPPPPDQPL